MSRRIQVAVGGQWTDWFAIWIPERASESERAKGEPVAYAISAPGEFGHWFWENGDHAQASENPLMIRFGAEEPRPYEHSDNNGLKWLGFWSLDELNQYLDFLVQQGRQRSSVGDSGPWIALGLAGLAAWMFFGSTKAPRKRAAR